MYAVCIALGASSAYVSVASVPASNNSSSSNDDGDDDVSATSTTAESPFASCYVVPAIRLVANAAGHRSTPLVASLTAHEVTFGDIAANAYVRQPQTVVPYVFAYAAAAAAVADTQRGGDATPTAAAADALLHIVRAASRVRMAGHCPLDEAALPPQPSAATTAASAQDDACATRGGRPRRLGFHYDADDDGGDGDASSRAFVAAEDLFVRFLNHIKRHVLDAACNLTETSSSSNKDATAAGGGGACSSDKDATTSTTRSRLVVTLVVPRYAFPAAALPSSSSSCAARAAATQWLREALYASHLGAVAAHVSVIFRDEAAYLAYTDHNSNNNNNKDNSNDNNESNTDARGAEDAAVLVVDWGAHALGISVLRERGGLLLDMHAPVQSPRRNHTKQQQQHDEEEHEQQQQASCVCPYMCFTSSLPSSSSLPSAPSSYWGAVRVYGGDAVDVALAERVAAQFVTQHRRRLASSGSAAVATLSPALLAHAGRTLGDGDDTTTTTTTTTALQQCLPARALRRLRLLMTDKKAALLSNAQATSVAVEVEAFADGIDLLDTQTLSRYKLDAAMRGEWAVAAQLTRALQSFVARNATLLRACAVREVVLVGGMCQVASTAAQLLRQVVTQQLQHAVVSSSSFAVRDATMTRLGGAALSSEEVVVVGGCYHSVHIAWTLQRERATRQRVRAITRKLHNKNSSGGGNSMARAAAGGRATAAAAATRAHKTALLQLSAVRHAMCDYGTSKNNGDDDDDDNDDAASSGDAAAAMQQQQQQQQQLLLHRGRCVAFLTRNVYVYSDADVTALQQCLRATTTAADKAASDEVTRAHARVRLARGALSRLFARNTPLPSRVVVPLPPRDERSDVTRARGDAVVLYLFTDDDDDDDSDKGGRAVQGDDAATTTATAAAVTMSVDGEAMLSLRALTPHGVIVPRTRRARDAVAVDNAAQTAATSSSTDNDDDVVANALVLTVQMHMDDDGAQRAVLSVQSVVQQSPSHDASAQTTTSPPPRDTVVVYATDVTL